MIRVLRGNKLLPSQKKFQADCSKILKNTRNALRWLGTHFSVFFLNHLGNETHKDLVAPETTMENIIRTECKDPMHGHPGMFKMLHALLQQYYSTNIVQQV